MTRVFGLVYEDHCPVHKPANLREAVFSLGPLSDLSRLFGGWQIDEEVEALIYLIDRLQIFGFAFLLLVHASIIMTQNDTVGNSILNLRLDL